MIGPRRWMRFVMVIAVALAPVTGVVALGGSGAVAPAAAQPTPPHRIFGFVATNQTEPVTGESVAVVYRGEVVANDTTDGTGYYDLKVPADEINTTASRNLTLRVRNASRNLTFSAGGSDQLNVTATPQLSASFFGVVTTNQTEPVAGATMEIVYRGSTVATATTNGSGFYELAVPGEQIDTTLDANLTLRVRNTTVDLRFDAGGSERVDVTVTDQLPSAFFGTVRTNQTETVVGAAVEVRYQGAVVANATTNGTGFYELSVAGERVNTTREANLTLRVRNTTADLRFDAGGSERVDVTVAEQSDHRVFGTVTTTDGDAASGVAVNVTYRGSTAATATTNGSGFYELTVAGERVNTTLEANLTVNARDASANLTFRPEGSDEVNLTIEPLATPGDANDDGRVTSGDATLVLRRVVGLSVPGSFSPAAADVNDDGQITSGDATLVLRIVVGLPVNI